jgi:hypothetical protein
MQDTGLTLAERPRRSRRVMGLGLQHHVGLMIALACFSYPVTTVILLALNIPTGTANLVLKSVIGVVYISLLGRAISRGFALPMRNVPLLAFFAVYSVRLLVDQQIFGITMDGYSAGYVYAYWFMLTVLPCIALLLCERQVDARVLHRWILGSLVLANLALVANALTGEGVALATLLANRTQVRGDELDSAVLSPLTYGLLGASLSALALARLCLMVEPRRHATPVLMALVFLGLVNMMLGASRGPFFGFMAATLVIIGIGMAPGKRPPGTPSRLRLALMIGLPLGALVALATLTDAVPLFLFDRLITFVEDRSGGVKEERDYQYASAIQDFLESPLVGKQFVTSYDHFYPHNIALEVLMATGVLGGLLFALILMRMLSSVAHLLKTRRSSHAVPIVLVGFCHLFAGMTSGNVNSSPEFWIFISLLTCLGIHATQKPKTHDVCR